MSLCPHGYTLNWDCPECECPGCGRVCDCCVCQSVVERPREDSTDLEDALLINLPHDEETA